MEHGKKVKRDMTRKSGRTVGSILTAAVAVLLNAVPAMAASEQHPDWYTFYDGAEHWSIFSIGRELGQLICLILTKILDFIEKDVYGAVFNSGATFFNNITKHTIFGDGFGTVVTAFLIFGLVSYGIWILLHTEQTSNTPRYFARQIVALVGTIILVPAMMGAMWNVAAGEWRRATESQAAHELESKNANTEMTALSASAECLNDNITDWYWMAGKGAIKSNVNSDSTDTAGGTDNAGGNDAGKDSDSAPRGQILWNATKAVKTVHGKKQLSPIPNTCNPWLGYAGWEMIDPMQYITKDGVDDYNETVDEAKIEQMVKKLKTREAQYGKKNSLEARKIYYEQMYYANLAKSGSFAKKHNEDKEDDGGQIPTDTRDKVFVVTESGASIKAANGGDGPLKALFKGGLVNPPYYRYTINWLPMIIELAALAVFLFMISLKVLRIMFDTIITGIVAPLFVAMDFWGESGQRTKTIYRSIVNAFLSIGAMVLEVEFFEIFCYHISYLNLNIPWYGAGFVKSLMYLAIGYIGVKGADIFKKMGLDVDNSATLQAGKSMARAGMMAGHKAKEGALKAAGLAGGVALAASAKPLAALKKPAQGAQKGSTNSAFANLAKNAGADKMSPLKANEKAIPADMKSGGKGDVPIGKTKGDDQQKDAITAGTNDPNNEQTKALEQDVNGSEETANVGGGANDDTAKVSDGDTGEIDAGAMTFQPDAGNEPQGVEGQQSDDVSSLQESANLDENSLPADQSAAEQNNNDLPEQEQSSEVNGHTSAPGVVGGEKPKQSAGEKIDAGKPGMENAGGGAKDIGAGDKPKGQVEQPKASAGTLNSNSGNSGVYQPTRKEPSRDSLTAEQASERLSASAKQSRVGTNSTASDTASTANNSSSSTNRFAATATDSIPTNTSATPIGGTGTNNLNGANTQDNVPVGGYQSSSGTNGSGTNGYVSSANGSGASSSGGTNRRVNHQAVSMGDDANVSLNAGKGSNITIQQSGTSGSEPTHGDTHTNGALKSSTTTSIPVSSSGAGFTYQSPHSTGQRAAMESRYAGKGQLGQSAASSYGHTMAAANNVASAVQTARRARANYVNPDTGKVMHGKVAKSVAYNIKHGIAESKRQEYAGYMAKGEEKYGGGGKGTTSREEEYASIEQLEDTRPDFDDDGKPIRAPHQHK